MDFPIWGAVGSSRVACRQLGDPFWIEGVSSEQGTI
ncbi:MAG: hypothetical protein JWO82_1225 [Akkermansiaceae bacterium]|nr:hypothetical protein [Akkermansiaceae bacterium]